MRINGLSRIAILGSIKAGGCDARFLEAGAFAADGEEFRMRSDAGGAPVVCAVLMSVYKNDSPRLFECAIRSILEQESPLLRVRIYLYVDGPVPPSIEGVIARLLGFIYVIVRSPENMGLAVGLNALIERLGDEEFVFRMDADDYSFKQRLSMQVAYMVNNPDVDVCGTAILEVDEQQRPIQIRQFPCRNDVRRLISRGAPIAHPTACFRSEVFRRFGLYPAVRFNEDIAYWFRLVEGGAVIDNLPMPLLEFSLTSRTFSRRGIAKAVTELKVYLDGLRRVNGYSRQMAFPILRFAFRLLPAPIVRMAYVSGLRTILFR